MRRLATVLVAAGLAFAASAAAQPPDDDESPPAEAGLDEAAAPYDGFPTRVVPYGDPTAVVIPPEWCPAVATLIYRYEALAAMERDENGPSRQRLQHFYRQRAASCPAQNAAELDEADAQTEPPAQSDGS